MIKSFFKIYKIIKENKSVSVTFLLFLILLSSFLETLSIGLVIPLISRLTNDNSDTFLGSFFDNFFSSFKEIKFFDFIGESNIILLIISFFVVIITFKTILLIYIAYFRGKFKYHLINNVSNKIFSNYLKKSYNFFLRENSSVLIRNCTSEVDLLVKASDLLLITLNEIILFIFLLVFLLAFNFKVTLLSLVVLTLFGIIFIKLTKKKITKLGKDRQLFQGKNFQFARETFGAIKEIIINNKNLFFLKQYLDTYKKISLINWSREVLQVLPKYLLEYLMFLAIFILIIFSFFLLKNTNNILITLTVYAAAGYKLLPCINRIITNIQQIKLFIPAIDVVYDETRENNTKQNIISSKQKIDFKKEIEIKNLTFSYKENLNILENLNFKIKKGKIIGIFGESGAGKSTLMDLICGLYKDYSGQINVDGKNIKDLNLNWQDKIGYVPQNTYLFDGSFEKNIAFGFDKDQINENDLSFAIKNSGLYELINSYKETKDKIIGEKGVTLSGGQRQRIGIARALYRNPEILVLDESLNALDLDTEIKILNSIKKFPNKTVIIVSHRMSTLEMCDEVYKVENKKIILTKN